MGKRLIARGFAFWVLAACALCGPAFINRARAEAACGCEDGLIYAQCGEYALALDAFEKAGSYKDAARWALYCRARLAVNGGDLAAAYAHLEPLAPLPFEDAEKWLIYCQARECFAYTGKFDYKNSAMNLKLVETLLENAPAATPDHAPTATPFIEPAARPDLAPAATPFIEPAATPDAAPAPAACAHADTYWTTTKSATCTDKGSQKKLCRACGATLATDAVPAKGHNCAQVSKTAATCTEKGYTAYKCKRCGGAKKDNAVNALGHNYGAWAVISDSADRRACARCGAAEDRAIVYGAWTEWQTAAVSAVKGSILVEKKTVNEQTGTKTTYSYSRYLYYYPAKGCNMASYGSTWADNQGYKGKWQNITRDSKLTYSRKSDGYNVYTGYKLDGNGYWFYEKTNTEAIYGDVTYYRSRRRTN